MDTGVSRNQVGIVAYLPGMMLKINVRIKIIILLLEILDRFTMVYELRQVFEYTYTGWSNQAKLQKGVYTNEVAGRISFHAAFN